MSDTISTLIPQEQGGWEIGSQLLTKDGRKCGNAVIVERVKSMLTPRWSGWIVVTDAGNEMNLTEPELDELFYPPKWKMNPQTAPGYVKWMLSRNRPTYGEHV
jgi:hypothetical protein